jgi:hypothetical protein
MAMPGALESFFIGKRAVKVGKSRMLLLGRLESLPNKTQ